MKFECVVPGAGIKMFGRAVHCLAKIGEEIFLEVHQDFMSLKTVNAARSAYACFVLRRHFFNCFNVQCTSKSPQQQQQPVSKSDVSIKLALKSFVSVFRSPTSLERTVDHFSIKLDSRACKLVFVFHRKHGIVKTDQLGYQDCDVLQAMFSKDLCPNQIIGAGRSLSEVASNFSTSLEEIVFTAQSDQLRLRNYTEESDDSRASATEVILHPQEFEDYRIGVDTSVTFCLKELRAILGFTDVLALPLSLRFETAGKPVIFSVDKGQIEHCTADFVLATLTESPAESSANPETTTSNDRDTSTAVPPDSDLDTTLASQAPVPLPGRPVSRFLNNVASSSGDSTNKITRRTGHRRPSSAGREAERATQPADLVDGLFDIENADEVMEQELNAAEDNQWFSHPQATQPQEVRRPSFSTDPVECADDEDTAVDSSGILPSTPPPTKKYKSVFSEIDMFSGLDIEENLTILAPDSENEDD